MRLWIFLGALSAAAAVAMGAAAAHALRASLPPDRLELVTLGATYQMWHALALVAVGLLAGRIGAGRLPSLCGAAFALGSLGFSGGLYNLAFGGPAAFHPMVPIGGGLFILGWLLLAATVLLWREPEPSR